MATRRLYGIVCRHPNLVHVLKGLLGRVQGLFFAALLLLPFLLSYQSTNPIARFDPNTKELLGLLPTQAHFNGTRRMRTLLVSLLCLSFDTFSKVEPTVGGCSTCHCTVAASTKSQRCKLELQNVSHFHLI